MSPVANAQERKEGLPSSKSKQVTVIRADRLLNITITKSGLELLQRLSALFNDVYNKRLPPSDDDDQPMLSLFNATGKEIIISNLDGLQVYLQYSMINFVFLLISLFYSLQITHHKNQLFFKIMRLFH